MKRTLVLMIAALTLSTATQAAVPLRVPVQGALRDNAGVPVANDVFAMRFALYPSPEAIEALWVEHHPPEGVDCGDLPQHCVHVEDGVFRVHLGAATSLTSSLFAQSGELWLGVRVETDPELPRRPLGSAPYALHAGSASHLACTGCVGLEALHTEAVAAMHDDTLAAVEALNYVTAAGALEAVETLNYVTASGAVQAVETLNYVTASGAVQAVAAEGYATSGELEGALGSLAPVAHTGLFSELVEIPPGLTDGDHDALGTLNCAEGQVPKRLGDTWTCAVDLDTTLTEEQVDAMVGNNGYAEASAVSALSDSLATVATTGSFNDLVDIPPALSDGDADTLATLTCTDGQVATYNEGEGAWICSDSVGAGGGGNGGTVVMTRCTWVGASGPSIDECTPPDCPAGWTDLGVTGNIKVGAASAGSSPITNSSYTTSYGYQERGCHHTGSFAVVMPKCTWVGSSGPSVTECTPPGCPAGWTDLGVTGNVKTNAASAGSSPITNSSYTTSSGYQERTCVF